MWLESFTSKISTTAEEVLAAVQDPFQRFREKDTGSHSINHEFDDLCLASSGGFNPPGTNLRRTSVSVSIRL